MYSIYVDGELLFSTAGTDDEHIILSPKCSPDVNGAGSLSFVMPPGHALYDSIRKLKGIITVERDGKIIFRGRAMDDEKDFYNQKDVYCEGDLSFLLDSIYAPGIYNGKVKDFFKLLIEKHNEQVDEEKRFEIGVIDAVDDETPYEASERVETRVYWDISTVIQDRLIGPYGGYLRTRTEDGVTYIDWLKKSGPENSQVIQFSVNLLDLKEKIDAADVFTILIPQGYSEIGSDGSYGDPLSVASVNDGLDYIQDDDAVAMFGKIWRTKTWSGEKDPAKLLEKGREYLKTGIAVQTLTLKAIDMHFLDGNAEAIKIGDYVRILSDPHGLDITLNCVKMDIDLLNPENTTYTFGEPPRTLTENVVRAEDNVGRLTGSGSRGGKSVQDELSDILRWAKNEVKLFATQETVDELGNIIENEVFIRLSAAENQITLKANKVYVDAEITEVKTLIADEIEAAKAEIDNSYLATISTNHLFALDFTFNGDNVSKSTVPVVTSFTQASGETATATDITFLTTATGSETLHDVAAGETKTF